eukprot:604100_1
MVIFRQHFPFSMVLLLVTSLVNAFESVKSITVHITDNSNAGAPYVKATLWFDTTIYQFNIDNPQRNTEYSLSSTEFTTIGQSDCMDASDTKIMIERDGSNAVMIDWITFETYSGIWYGIDGWCAYLQSDIDYYLDLDPSSDYYDWIEEDPECPLGYSHAHFCVDNDSCAPAKQIFYFDVSTPNEYITDALWEDGTDVAPQIITCNPSNRATDSPSYDPSNRPSVSPTNDPSNGPTASPIATDDPSNGPTATPTEPTHSPTDSPFAQPTSSPTQKQIHAVNAKTPSPTQSTAEATTTNHGSTSTDSVDMDNSVHDTENITHSVMWPWIGVICALLIVASIVCFGIWKSYRKLKDLQHVQDVGNMAKRDDAKNMSVVDTSDEKMPPNTSTVHIEEEQMDDEEDSSEGLYVNCATQGQDQTTTIETEQASRQPRTQMTRTNDLINIENVLQGSVVMTKRSSERKTRVRVYMSTNMSLQGRI